MSVSTGFEMRARRGMLLGVAVAMATLTGCGERNPPPPQGLGGGSTPGVGIDVNQKPVDGITGWLPGPIDPGQGPGGGGTDVTQLPPTKDKVPVQPEQKPKEPIVLPPLLEPKPPAPDTAPPPEVRQLQIIQGQIATVEEKIRPAMLAKQAADIKLVEAKKKEGYLWTWPADKLAIQAARDEAEQADKKLGGLQYELGLLQKSARELALPKA